MWRWLRAATDLMTTYQRGYTTLDDFRTLELLLREALTTVERHLASTDVHEVVEFLDVAEYGLAFETLVCAVVDAGAPVSTAFCSPIHDAGRQMGYRDDFADVRNHEVAAALSLVWQACRTCEM